MVRSKRAHRRLSLLASSSLVIAALAGAAPVLLTPDVALAANECGDPGANGATADTFDCTGNHPGITYSTNGDLTLRMNNGVATTTGGVQVSSSGTNTVTISRLDTPAGSGDPSLVATSGSGVGIGSTGTGAITVTLSDGDTGDTPLVVRGVTHGMNLSGGATSGNAIAVTTTHGQVTATAGVGIAAVNNSTAGGNISLTLGSGVSGTTGGLAMTINGAGTQTITLSAQSATVSGGDVAATTGSAVQMTTAGTGTGGATLTVGGGRTVRSDGATNAVVAIANANGARTITNNGAIRSNDATAAGYDDFAISVGAGTGVVTIANTTLNSTNAATGLPYTTATLSGRISLANTGTATINNNTVARVGGGSIWHTSGTSILGSGNTTLNNNTTTVTISGVSTRIFAVIGTSGATTLDFGTGTDTFKNDGKLAVGEGAEAESTLTLANLETWNNSGYVFFGATGDYTASDDAPNDRISAAGLDFRGLDTNEGSAFFMDVDLDGAQADCSAATSADCLDLTGGTTGGETAIVVNSTGGLGVGQRMVLVDVGGGFSDEAHFVLSSTSDGYDSDSSLDFGPVRYALRYDGAAQQHYLIGAPDGEALEFGLFPGIAREALNLVTASWFERDADLRVDGTEALGGAWVKLAASNTDQILEQSFGSGEELQSTDTSYAQDTQAISAGVDLLRTSAAGATFLAGVTAGKIDAEAEFEATASALKLDGYSFGAYASLLSGPLFVGAIVNSAKLDVVYDAPGLATAGSEGELGALGAQVEAGWRLPIPRLPAFIEPLAALSWVKTDSGELGFTGGEVVFQDTTSVRAGLGLRIAGYTDAGAWTTRFSFTGRAWEELDGEAAYALQADDMDIPLAFEHPSGRLGELGFGVGVTHQPSRFSVRAGAKLQFKRDYENRQFAISARLAF